MSASQKASPENYSQLPFRIVYCSGEDEDHPASELLKQGSHCKGWESARFCEFPQIVIVQFMGIIALKQIQFLSHQAKIATKIELFTYAPSGKELPGPEMLQQLKFKRLGFLSLDNNERSNFTARELKSVYVDTPSLYLKVQCHKCHVNKYNIFNQVGIVALNCLGETAIPGQPGTHGFGTFLEDFANYDPVTLERMKILHAAKERSVAVEDYDEANRLKEVIDKLKTISKQLSMLEEKKRLSVQNEDYQSAKVIKVEIDRLRNSVLTPMPMEHGTFLLAGPPRQPPLNPPSPYMPGGPGAPASVPSAMPMPMRPDLIMEEGKDSSANKSLNTGFERVKPEREPIEYRGGKFNRPTGGNMEESKGVFGGEDVDTYGKMGDILGTDQSRVPPVGGRSSQAMLPHDEQVIPTVANQGPSKQPPGEEEYESYDPEGVRAEPLTEAGKKIAQQFFGVFELPLLEMCFSGTWQLRDKALGYLQEEVIKRQYKYILIEDRAKIIACCIGLGGFLIEDKISQVSMKAMSMIETCCSFHEDPIDTQKQEFNAFADQAILSLIDRLGNNQPKVRAAAEHAMMSMCAHPSVGPWHAALVIVKGKQGKVMQNSMKHIQGKLNILTKLIEEFGIDQSNTMLNSIIKYGIDGVKHNHNDIRNAGYGLLVEIYKNIGASIRPFLTTLRPAQMEVIEGEFAKIEGYDMAAPKEQPKPQTTVSTNIKTGPHGGKKQTKGKAAQPFGHGKGSKSNMNCEYCGKYDPHFSEDTLDIHMWKDCPMLCFCPSCENVVEILSLNQHLIEECENKEGFRECARCKEAVGIEEYEQHVEELGCNPGHPTSQCWRCPLCHVDVKPAHADGWKEHILVRQCPNNERMPS